MEIHEWTPYTKDLTIECKDPFAQIPATSLSIASKIHFAKRKRPAHCFFSDLIS